MALFPFRRRPAAPSPATPLAALLAGHSIEVMPRTAARIPDFAAILPAGTRVCVAHIAGTGIDEMVATAARLRAEGMEPMPHVPARLYPSRAALAEAVARYRGEAGVGEALLLAGGAATPAGPFASSMALMESGLFEGFARLHVAGHPEGSRDIDPDGSDRVAMAALRWKQDFARHSGVAMAIVTQFCFEAAPVIAWAGRLAAEGIDLPIHVGIAGPAKLQTLVRHAIACGVGPSLRVLERRAADVTRLLLPHEPDAVLTELAAEKARNPGLAIERVHFFPLGGIAACTDWIHRRTGPGAALRNA